MTSSDSGRLPELLRSPIPLSPRREDIETKQAKIASWLLDADCESMLLLDRANVRWMTSGMAERGVHHAEESPAVFANHNQRWIICSNVDTQRLFDEELDGLGFQVKEWPSTVSREQFLAELCHGRRMASDRPFRDFKFVGPNLEQERRRLGAYEQDRLRELGRLLVHALEASARNLHQSDTEWEVAGQLAHRLLKRGAEPLVLSIAAEDRARTYRRPGFTSARITTRCLLQATAMKFGLFATASRTVCFGAPGEATKQEFETASRLAAVWQATLKPGDRPAALYEAANFLRDSSYEHEVRLSAPGWWTARMPSEVLFTPSVPERFSKGQALVWQARIGGMAVCETCLVQENAIIPVVGVEEWPFRRYVIQGARFDLPDLLIRNPA